MNAMVSCEELQIVIVDDDRDHRRLIRTVIENHCDAGKMIHVDEYEDPATALVNLPPEGNVVLLVDYNLNGLSGLDWIHDFTKTAVGPLIMITSSGDEEIAAKAFRMGATDYLEKGDIIREPVLLWTSINRAMRRFKLESTNRELARNLKLTNSELRSKNEHLAILTKNAQQFVEDVAHEFRTPLTVIREFASIMSDGIGGEVTTKQSGYLDFISNATCDLAHLIDDFLDSGKLRAGMLRVSREPHHVEEIYESNRQMIEARALSKEIQIKLDIPSDLPHVYADCEKAGRALLNLTTNAIKFTKPMSSVTIRAKLCESDIRFEVEDNGPGLTSQVIEHLFERFRQCESTMTTTDKGFGLGLGIVRDLVNINLGSVEITSDQNSGSIFSFSLPINNIESIIQAFMKKAFMCEAENPIAAFKIDCEPMSNGKISPKEFLASVCYSSDLVLNQFQDESIFLIGQTSNYKKWMQRLQECYEKKCSEFGFTPGTQLGIKLIGLWHADEESSTVCSVMTREVVGGRNELLSIDC